MKKSITGTSSRATYDVLEDMRQKMQGYVQDIREDEVEAFCSGRNQRG
jgi:hypothetical protein